jgi:hypothetical protein
MPNYTSITYKQTLTTFTTEDETDKFIVESLETGAVADVTLVTVPQREISITELFLAFSENNDEQPYCILGTILFNVINEQNTKDKLRDYINTDDTLIKKWSKLDYPTVPKTDFMNYLKNIDTTVKTNNINTIMVNDIVEFIFLFSNISDSTKSYKIKIPFNVVD